MENLIEKMKEELEKEMNKVKGIKKLGIQERCIIMGKVEALRDCINWAELAQIENKYK